MKNDIAGYECSLFNFATAGKQGDESDKPHVTDATPDMVARLQGMEQLMIEDITLDASQARVCTMRIQACEDPCRSIAAGVA